MPLGNAQPRQAVNPFATAGGAANYDPREIAAYQQEQQHGGNPDYLENLRRKATISRANNDPSAARDQAHWKAAWNGRMKANMEDDALFQGQLEGMKQSAATAFGPKQRGYAEGGEIVGPGGPTDDMVPAVVNGQETVRLSDDEFIMTALAKKYWGTKKLNEMNQEAEMAEGGLPKVGMPEPDEDDEMRGYKDGGELKTPYRTFDPKREGFKDTYAYTLKLNQPDTHMTSPESQALYMTPEEKAAMILSQQIAEAELKNSKRVRGFKRGGEVGGMANALGAMQMLQSMFGMGEQQQKQEQDAQLFPLQQQLMQAQVEHYRNANQSDESMAAYRQSQTTVNDMQNAQQYQLIMQLAKQGNPLAQRLLQHFGQPVNTGRQEIEQKWSHDPVSQELLKRYGNQ